MKIRLNTLGADLSGMRVSTQLYGAFALMILLCLAVGAIGLFGMQRMGAASQVLHDKWLSNVGHLSAARSAIVEARAFEIKHSRTDDRSYHSEYEEKIQAARAAAGNSIAAYRNQLPAEGEEKGSFDALSASWLAYGGALEKVLQLGKSKKQLDAADISDGAALMAYEETLDGLAKLLEFNFNGGYSEFNKGVQVQSQSRLQALGLTALALLAALVLAQVITRGLIRQLGGEPAEAARVVSAVAQGDLTAPVVLRADDEASLMASLNRMKLSLIDAVSQVRRGAEGVAASSSEIAQGNQDLSARTEQQSSALQQTASTMEQLGVTVRKNAEHAQHANELAAGASAVATQGGGMVVQVVETMKGINDSSRKIADIISVIDGIAFQTNILALNAAVEAARAGDQGRGFAVVAGEVRSLAQRSANAAKEIKDLINASVDRVAQGTAQVDRAGKTMSDIVLAIQKVSQAVGEISAASDEQSRGVSLVEAAVTSMDSATQQNAALVEQSAAAAETLRSQAHDLLDSVAVFRTKENQSQVGLFASI